MIKRQRRQDALTYWMPCHVQALCQLSVQHFMYWLQVIRTLKLLLFFNNLFFIGTINHRCAPLTLFAVNKKIAK